MQVKFLAFHFPTGIPHGQIVPLEIHSDASRSTWPISSETIPALHMVLVNRWHDKDGRNIGEHSSAVRYYEDRNTKLPPRLLKFYHVQDHQLCLRESQRRHTMITLTAHLSTRPASAPGSSFRCWPLHLGPLLAPP